MDLEMLSGIVDGYNHEGMGLIRRDKEIIFVPGVLEGEEVRVRLTGRRKGVVAWGEATDILRPSAHRLVPLCPHYARCGGCQLLHASYAHQLDIKRGLLERALAPLRKADEGVLGKIQPPVPAPEPYGYRNKGIFALGQSCHIGFYGRHSREVAGHGCVALFSGRVNKLLDAVSGWLADHNPLSSLPRHIMVRESKIGGGIALTLIGPKAPAWLPDFCGAFSIQPAVSGIGWLSSPDKPGPVADARPQTLWGDLSAEEILDPGVGGPLHIRISPEAFFQVNTCQANALYAKVLEACALAGGETVWDLYCGSGAISLFLARRAASVLGVDLSKASIRDAGENARRNALAHRVRFIRGAAEKVLQSLPQSNTPEVVVLDPPAKGAKAPVLDAVAATQPRNIVYVSCDPATLARDLGILIGNGQYGVECIQPVDMFPQTAHVETVVSLRRKPE